MPDARLPNGTRRRVDGLGDGWAKTHRVELGPSFMQDVDGLMGNMAWALNTGDKLFWEYEPDSYKNHGSAIREFAVVALFDRKASELAAFSERNTVAFASYLWLCRQLAKFQPVKPKFFFVIGPDPGPWKMIEIDPETAQKGSVAMLKPGSWRETWESFGLSSMRKELQKWLLK